jgi:hypothetical protein
MADNLQSKVAVKIPKAAKTVVVKGKSDAVEVVAAATINETALSFIRAWKKARANQQ